MTETVQEYLTLNGMDAYLALFGANERNVSLLEGELGVKLSLRGSEIKIEGEAENVGWARQVLEKLMELEERHTPIDRTTLRYACALVKEDGLDRLDELAAQVVAITHRGRPVRCKTLGQYDYVKAIREHELTFAVGPAGTGKTYLAMALAVAALKRHEVGRLILTRPVVEAGENLGFLPGTLEEKIDPYMRPLYDALFDMMDRERTDELMERGVIEIAPLAYMRGRTLSDAFVVLDEAQNTTPEQMKMFLTRLGFNSKFVITGDLSQRDLVGRRGGLADVEQILGRVDDVAFSHLERADVVRHALVGRIVEAYDAYDDVREKRVHDRKESR